jgi:hypothetical protein
MSSLDLGEGEEDPCKGHTGMTVQEALAHWAHA